MAHRGSTVVVLYFFVFFAQVFQRCCSTPRESQDVGRNTLVLSCPRLSFIIVFIRDLFVSRDGPLMS